MSENDELLGMFVAETRDHLELAEESLLAIERDPEDGEALQSCFRALHSLKGNALYFDLRRMQALAHAAEQLLDRLRTHSIVADAARVAALLQVVSLLGRGVAALEQGAVTDDAIAADEVESNSLALQR